MTIATPSTGLPASAARPDAASRGMSAETSAHRELRKAAQEFEGMLISQLLGEFHLSPLGADAPMAGSDTLNSLATQTFSTALAARGGLGIARTLAHQLEPSLNRSK